MNSARELLKSGHAHAARLLLNRLTAASQSEEFDLTLRFRLETNLGAASLVLSEYQTAEPHFEFALSLKPEDPKAISNRGLIARLQNQATTALEYATKAFLTAPDDPQVVSIYLQALDASGKTDEARRIANESVWMRTDGRCALVLALIEFKAGEYSDAESLARASLAAEPDDAQAMELVARSIIVPLRSELYENPPLPGKLPSDVLDRATEAEALLNKAETLLEHQDHKQLLVAVIANRGVVLSILGRFDEAQRDYDRVLSLDPSQHLVKVNKARLLLETGSPFEAIQLLEAAESVTGADSWHPLAIAYLAIRQPQKALSVLLQNWKKASNNRTRIRVAELMLDAYSDLADTNSASKLATCLEAEFPSDPEAIVAVAKWRASQPGNFEIAISLLFSALESANDKRQKDPIMLSLAGLYYKKQRFAESADLYGKLLPYFDHLALFRRYLLSLYYGGLHREALDVAAGKRAGGRAISLVSAVEAHLLEEIGDLQSAETLLVELVEIEPDDADHRIHLAYLRYRRGDFEGSKQTVLGVGIEEVKGSAHQLLALAKVRAWLDLDGVLELAYRARRVGFDDASIHQGFISLFLDRKRNEDARLEVNKITPGTTVHLQSEDGNARVVTIVDGLDADLRRGELLPSDPVALALLGRVANEYITLKQTALETLRFRIAKVESQYVFAFQETLGNFSTWFPDYDKGPEKLTMDDGGVDKMLHIVGQRYSYVNSVLALYRAKRITLGMLAQLVGRSVIEIWSSLQDDGETGIIASTGQESNSLKLASAQELILDLSALLTFASLGLLSALKKRFSVLPSTQFVFDELRDDLTLERAGLRNTGTLSLKGDRYVMEASPKIETGERRLFLEMIVEFIKSNVMLLPAPALLETPLDQKSALGRSGIASILIAKHRGSLLCSDDLVLRQIAEVTWRVRGTWSQEIIMELRRSGTISQDEYHEATMSLVHRNYVFVRVNEQDFLWLLRHERMCLTERFVNSLRVLRGPDCTEDSAVVIAGAFLRAVCMEAELQKTRHLLIDASISVLKHGRQPAIVLSKLDAHVQRLMMMNPEALADVRQAIALWKREPDLLDKRSYFNLLPKGNRLARN
jgi:tetratricopeptide (TPR) repeat protein